MPFDSAPDTARPGKRLQGLTNYQDGLSAEDTAARHYEAAGATIIARRWRGRGGEIDLIGKHDGVYLFIEVKKSACFDSAAHLLSPRQLGRIALAAQEYMDTHADPFADMRLDLAMVDRTGRIEILQNLTLY